MAEAHSAVAFSFAITHDGWDVNFDREVLYLVWESGIRSWKKRLARFRVSTMKTATSLTMSMAGFNQIGCGVIGPETTKHSHLTNFHIYKIIFVELPMFL